MSAKRDGDIGGGELRQGFHNNSIQIRDLTNGLCRSFISQSEAYPAVVLWLMLLTNVHQSMFMGARQRSPERRMSAKFHDQIKPEGNSR